MGDLGKVDENGVLYITGRIKRIIMTKGSDGNVTKMFPDRIEKAIQLCDDVELACVIGVRDEERINIPKAYIELKDRSLSDEQAVRRLISTLCENAVKHAPEDSDIVITLIRSGKNAVFSTENATKEPLDEEALTHLFDRFYRGDASRSKEENTGFGIGLSIARAITEKHGGSIKAAVSEDGRLQITCTLPLN